MSLVYLITSLPDLKPGKAPPIEVAEFAERARSQLSGFALADLEQVLLVDEIEKTVLLRNRHMLGLHDSPHSPEKLLRDRALKAGGQGSLLPGWVLKERPLHLLFRYWFQKVYSQAHSHFLKRYCRVRLNFEECVAGLLCKLEDMPRAGFETQMEGGFDSTWRVMMQRYGEPDLGLGGRLRNFHKLKEILQMDDLLAMEQKLDEMRFNQIERCLGVDPFDVEQVLAYYFRLRLVHRQAARNREKGRRILDEILHYQSEMTP